MSTAVLEKPAVVRAAGGGLPARRAVMRWAWRLFRREWRQQLLVLALIVVAVGAVVVGAAVATNTPPAANAGFGTAGDLATFPAPDPHLSAQIAALQHRFGRVDVIENQALAIPGSIESYDLRAQNPNGPFGQPMLSLLSGHYPTAANQVALTPAVASAFGVSVGDPWHEGGITRTVVGIVQNPQSLLDEFALVIPGQVKTPTLTTVLFNAPGVRPATIGPNVETPQSAGREQPAEPDDDRARAGHDRHAPHRPGVGGRLHRAGAAAAALARHARRAGRHRPQRPPGRAGQRARGRRGRRGSRVSWSAWPSGWPTGRAWRAARITTSPRSRCRGW